MAVGYNPRIVTDGLSLTLDAGVPTSWNAGISTNWTDKIGGNNGTLFNGTYHNDGPFVGAGYVEFDGTDDHLSIADSADLDLSTGDFTIEFWVYAHSLTNSDGIVGKRGSSSFNSNSWRIAYNSTNSSINLAHTSSNSVSVSYAPAPSLNTWTHYAFARESGTMRAFKNGVKETDVSSYTHDFSNTYSLLIAANASSSYTWDGYISNVRVVKGTALYTSNFTPPTKPLTAVTNTTLLTCQGNAIADASSSAHTLTANGGISLTKEPFGGAGAVEFDGSGDYLSIADASGVTVGTGDFTIEYWINLATSRTPSVWWASGTSSVLISDTGAAEAVIGSSTDTASGYSKLIDASSSLAANTWGHVAVVRSSGTTTIYLNGVSGGNTTSITGSFDCAYIGRQKSYTPRDINGFISNLRLIKGTALYTSNFTPPAEPLTAVTNTELLTCQGQNIKDASSNAHAITVNGDAKATIVSSSFEFDGTDDYVDVGSTNIPAGPLTVSAWINLSSEVSIATIAASNGDWIFGTTSRKPFAYNYASAAQTTAPSGHALSIGVWYNVVMVQGSSLDVYINGSLSATNSDGTDMTATEDLDIGRRSGNNDRYHHGKIADLKIYSKALTAAEVTQNYNATKGRYV